MKVVVFGASGMVGQGVLRESLASAAVESVLVVGRTSCGVTHPKLREVVRADLFDASGLDAELAGQDRCCFCLGVSAAGLDEAQYAHITFDLTLAWARALLRLSPGLTFCYVSGASTDSSERGRMMWARVKGRTENALLGLGFAAAYMFRPGYIQPMHGVQSKTKAYRAMYAVLVPLYPVLKTLFPNQVTTTEKLGRALLRVGQRAPAPPILGPREINALGGEA